MDCGAAPQSISVPNNHYMYGADYLPPDFGVLGGCGQAPYNLEKSYRIGFVWDSP